MMNAEVTEKRIGDGYYVVSFAGSDLFVLDEESGFFNPAQLCQLCGKEVRRYNELPRKKKLEHVLKPYSKKVCYKKKNQNSLIAGWYLHPTLLLDLAQWVSPQAFAAAAIVVGEIFQDTGRKSKLSDLLKCGNPPTCKLVRNCPLKWSMRFMKRQFMVDERGWFDTAQFCRVYKKNKKTNRNSKTLTDFKASKGMRPLFDYLREKSLPSDQSYYHPLLFLRLAAWVDIKYFVKFVHLIFCSDNDWLHWRIYKTIKDAGSVFAAASLPTVQSTASQLSTSGGQPCPSECDFNARVHNEQGTNVKDKVMDDGMISRKEHEQEVAKLQQKVAELQQKEAELQHQLEGKRGKKTHRSCHHGNVKG